MNSIAELERELADVRDAVSTARHELNNHLTAAFAEIRLLLMDVESESLRESYQIVHEALSGIQASVASIANIRR